jgi:hypothetical protein
MSRADAYRPEPPPSPGITAQPTTPGGIAIDVLVCLLLAAATIYFHLPRFSDPVGLMEEGLLLVYPRLMFDGWIMHRDFQTGYGPGAFWLQGLWYALFGTTTDSARALTVLYRVAAAWAAYLLLRPHGRVVATSAAIATAACVFVMSIRAATWFTAGTFLLFQLVCLFAATRTHRPRRAIALALLTGLLGGAAITIRLDTVAFAVVVSAPLVAWHLKSALGRPAVYAYLTGLALGTLPFLIHIAIASPGNVYQNMFVDPVVLSAPGRVLPLPPADPYNLRRFHVLLAALALLVTSAMMAVLQRRRQPVLPTVILAVVALCLCPYILQRADIGHFAIGLAVLLPLTVLGLCHTAAPLLAGIRRPMVRSVVALPLAAVAPFLAWYAMRDPLLEPVPFYSAAAYPLGRTTVITTPTGQGFPVPTHEAAAYRALIESVTAHAPHARTIYVAPANLRTVPYGDLHLYHLFPHLRPSGYFFEMNPGCTNRPGSRFASDLAAADLLILGTKYDNWWEPNASTRPGSPEGAETVAREFTLLADHGLFRLYGNRRIRWQQPAQP